MLSREGKDLLREATAVYFLGIGGIGMSAIARYCVSQGKRVSGYDKTETPLTKQLVQEGMLIHYDDDVEKIDKDADFVVYTPAIPVDHKELIYLRENEYSIVKRSEVLGWITSGHFNICVAGTHGKTTTSAMIAHILRDSGYGCTAFLGGIASNYNSNFWSVGESTCVAEADEYDRSFLHLQPNIAVITAMDADHLDIYGSEDKMQDAFIAFTERIKTGGTLISRLGLLRYPEMQGDMKLTYDGSNHNADVYATNLKVQHGSYCFDAVVQDKTIEDLVLNMGGLHNIENVLAAITVAMQLNISKEKIKEAVANFSGVKRRFEYIIRNDAQVMIDDYAHHPEELRALINSARSLFPGRPCTVVFQPHLYSRTNDLADAFAEVLSLADETILLPIYPARELPVAGVSSQMILDKMTNAKKSLKGKDELLVWMKKEKPSFLITCGAGDIDALVAPIREILNT